MVILKSMKMEIPQAADVVGTVTQILVTKGQFVEEGQTLATIEP